MLAGIIAPPLCVTCSARCPTDQALCPGCDRELTRGTGRALSVPGVDHAWAARPYEGVARELIHAVKFRSLVPGIRRAAELVAAEVPAELAHGPYLPVPADPLRSAWRGFDPAGSLAHELGRSTGSPVSPCLRRSHGPRQVGRDRRERLAAQIDIRAIRPPRHAVLVDDVATTGATLVACALALRTAGCERVGAVVLAATRA